MAEGMDLGKKVGPLPLGGWVLVVGAGLAVGYFINRNAGKAEPQQLTESGVGKGGGTFLPIDPPTSTPEETLPETNLTWAMKAKQYLVAQGIDALIANTAVEKFLSGQTLSAQESAAISMALGKLGPPPEGVAAPPDDPRPKAPSNLVVTLKTSNSVSLAWSPVAGASSYEVIASSSGGSWAPSTTLVPLWSSKSTGKVLGANMPHTFFVRAVNEFGKSEPASIQVTTSGGIVTPPPIKPPVKPPVKPPAPPAQRRHVIARGDTLWGISRRYYGTGTRWLQIYQRNAGAIEASARAHGKKSSRGPTGQLGWWIFPGATIWIP
jgi:nucleoid-associated protein YgaU